jgi:predicted MFS family arabinose efflux permease
VAKTIPPQRRSSLWALRFILTTAAGIGVGIAVKAILQALPGTTGYALLHLITFAMLTISLLFFMRVRETPYPLAARPDFTLTQNLRRLPGLFARQRRVLYYLMGAATVGGIYVVLPWLSIHALTRLGQSDAFAGYLLTAYMLGAIVGNLLAGYAGDRVGGKYVCAASRVVFLLVCLWAPLAASTWEFYALYALLGAAWYGNGVGASTLELEICPREDRLSYLAVIAAVRVPSILAAALAGCWLWQAGGHRVALPAYVSAAAMILCIFFTLLVREPRGEKLQTTDVPAI